MPLQHPPWKKWTIHEMSSKQNFVKAKCSNMCSLFYIVPAARNDSPNHTRGDLDLWSSKVQQPCGPASGAGGRVGWSSWSPVQKFRFAMLCQKILLANEGQDDIFAHLILGILGVWWILSWPGGSSRTLPAQTWRPLEEGGFPWCPATGRNCLCNLQGCWARNWLLIYILEHGELDNSREIVRNLRTWPCGITLWHQLLQPLSLTWKAQEPALCFDSSTTKKGHT